MRRTSSSTEAWAASACPDGYAPSVGTSPHSEHYGIPADEDITDIEWLTLAGARGWAALMKDDRIRRRPAELAALKAAGVHAFCIANANLDTEHQVEVLLHHQDQIFHRYTEPRPTLDSLSKTGMRPIAL